MRKNNTYDNFTGKELEIAELIQQRRLQILVHSCIYYELNRNSISDELWDKWARELVKLQKHYPDIAKKVMYHDAFKDWDASTGAFLPLKDEWVMSMAHRLVGNKKEVKSPVKTKTVKKKLF